MIKLKRFLYHSFLIITICLILLLIPASFLPYRQSTTIIYNAPWFKLIFGFLFFSLTLGWIIVSLLLKKLKSIITHLGVLLILVGAFLSSGSTHGRVAVNEGESFQSFYEVTEETHAFSSPIVLLKFNEEDLSNTVVIAGKEYRITPSHPLEMWGYFFYTYDYDVKWDIREVVITDHSNNEYLFEPTNRKHFVSPYFLNFVGLAVNNNGDTLSEFVIFKNDSLVGAVFVGRYGILAPSYGLDLRLVHSHYDVSFISTILIKKDPGLPYVLLGFVLCLVGFIVSFLDKRWMN